MDFKHKLNRGKQLADTVLDPLLLGVGYNYAILEASAKAMQQDSLGEQAAGGLLGGAALALGNYFMFTNKHSPLLSLAKRALRKFKAGDSADWKNWAKTAVIGGALAYGLSNSDGIRMVKEGAEELRERFTPEQTMNADTANIVLEDRIRKPLEGRVIPKQTLYAYYTGIDSVLTDASELPSNQEILAENWQRKFRRHGKRSDTLSFYDEKIANFNEEGNERMGLEDYITSFDQTIDEINQNLNWEGLIAGEKKVVYGSNNKERLEVLEGIARRVNANHLVSIGLKEVFPPNDGDFNAEVFDHLLSSRGKKFTEYLPSQNDRILSIGLFQLTNDAVYDNGHKKKGASTINQFLPEEMQIPGSLAELEGWDFEKAAYMNLVAGLAHNLSEMNLETVKMLKDINDDDLIVLLGGLHHRPRDARTAVSYWAANNAEQPMIRSMNQRLTGYNILVRDNNKGLEEYKSRP